MQNNFYFIGNFSNIYKSPSKRSEVTSQIIHGEKFKILAKNKNWIKIKTLFDNYKGFIKNSKYIKKFSPNYKVSSLKAKIYKKPGIGTSSWLPLASKLFVFEQNKNYVKIKKNKWIKKADIKKINHKENNFTKIFKKFLDVKLFGVEKHLKVLIVQPYCKYFIVIIIRFIQEIQKIRSNIQKRIQRKDYLKKEILFFGKVMLLCV